MIKLRILSIIAFSCLVLSLAFYGCGDQKTKEKVRKYTGDGTIQYLDKPGPLGVSGVKIDFRPFDLSSNYFKKFDITSIPEGSSYSILLVPIGDTNIGNYSSSNCSYELFRNDKLVSTFSSNIGEMRTETGIKPDKLYFYKKGEGPIYLTIDDANVKWEIVFAYKKSKDSQGDKAFFSISEGGFK